MDDRALVEIFVPAAERSFDVFIPLSCKMSEVIGLCAKLLTSLSDGKYMADENAVLCNADSGIIYNINMEIAELGIRNGTRLMLI